MSLEIYYFIIRALPSEFSNLSSYFLDLYVSHDSSIIGPIKGPGTRSTLIIPIEDGVTRITGFRRYHPPVSKLGYQCIFPRFAVGRT